MVCQKPAVNDDLLQTCQKQLARLALQLGELSTSIQVESNWVCMAVLKPEVPYWTGPAATGSPVGRLTEGTRVIRLDRAKDQTDGVWVQIRVAEAPTERYWLRLSEPGQAAVTLGYPTF